MAQTAAQIAEGNAIVTILSEASAIAPSTIIVEGPSPVTVGRVIASILALLANG